MQGHQLDLEDEEGQKLPFLPDDVVIEVFAYLSVRELFTARVVCRRWADLALHADVWRHRDLKDSMDKAACGAALRLAPCVRYLELTGFVYDDGDTWQPLGPLAESTRCASKSLVLGVHDDNARRAARVVRNQANLGRLTKLKATTLQRRDGQPEIPLSANTFELVAACCTAAEGLKKLHLSVEEPEHDDDDEEDPVQQLPWPAVLQGPGNASLKNLTFEYDTARWGQVLDQLIERHAATLETVYLARPPFTSDADADLPGSWTTSVSKASGLTGLSCPLPRHGVAELLKCDSIRMLQFGLDGAMASDDAGEEDAAAVRQAQDFLRRATNVRALLIHSHSKTITYMMVAPDEVTQKAGDETALATLAVALIEGLASSGRSQASIVCVDLVWDDETSTAAAADGVPLLDKLSAALAQLPALCELHVCVEGEGALLRVLESVGRVGRLASGLTSPAPPRHFLMLHLKLLKSVGCVHAWVHRQTARLAQLFRANPILHLSVRAHDYCEDEAGCDACSRRCHSHRGAFLVLFYGHREEGSCPLQHGDGSGAYNLAYTS